MTDSLPLSTASSSSPSASSFTSSSSSSCSSSVASSSITAATISDTSPTSTAADGIEELLMPKDAKEAEEAKARGNALYAQKDYEGAVCAYGDGLLLCPADAALLRSVLLNNRAAAHLQLHAYADVIADCSSSLALQSSTKALLRRSTAYEKTGKVSEAISDLQAAIAASSGSPGGASREDEVRLRRLEAEKAAADEKMKTEMLGKLKELGNGLLGKFGLSLDQFQAVKDQHTGSYSISFNKAT